MLAFRISRNKEFAPPDWRRGRLYAQEAGELVSALNSVRSVEPQGPPNEDGRSWTPSYRRARRPRLMDGSAEWLIRIICDDVRERSKEAWLTSVLADLMKTRVSDHFSDAVAEYVHGGSPVKEKPFFGLVTSLVVGHANQLDLGRTRPQTIRPQGASLKRMTEVWAALRPDGQLLDRVIRLRDDAERHGRTQSALSRRRSVEELARSGTFTPDEATRELEAVEFFERNSAEIDLWFAFLEQIGDIAIVLALRIFGRWVNEKLQEEGLSFRVAPDRLTSTYRLVPVELYARLDRPHSTELRLVEPRTTLSASFIAYITKLGMSGRLEEWVGAVDLIDQLAFDGVLDLIDQCRVCGRWMLVLTSRRTYCGGQCRYKLWARTPKGKEKRRRASAAWRRRFSEEIRKATPKLRRGRRNH